MKKIITLFILLRASFAYCIDEIYTTCFLISQNNKANDLIIFLDELNHQIYGIPGFTTNGILNQFDQDVFSIALWSKQDPPIYNKCISVAESIK